MQDFIINPNSGRPVRVGSRLYNSLVFKGILDLKNEKKNAPKTQFRLVDEESVEAPARLKRTKLDKKDWLKAISILVFNILDDDLMVCKLQKMRFEELHIFLGGEIIKSLK